MTNRINMAFKEIKNSRETCLCFSNIVLTSPKAVSGIPEHPTSADKTLSPNVHVLQQQQQTNNNPDPSSPVELLLVRTTRKKTLEKSSNQYGMKVPTRNAKDQIIGQIPMKHPGLDEQNPDQFTI